MTDSRRPFLQMNATWPHPDDDDELMRMMCFANPALLFLLKSASLELFMDATFSMTPVPFYQTFIVMVFDRQTSMFVPITYILMTNKTEALYMHVLAQLTALANFRLDVKSFTSDFERAMINAGKHHFPGSTHNGCFFHFKQAICKHMVEKLGFHWHYVSNFMIPGNLDLLCILPLDEIKPYGIPFLRDIFESDLSLLADIYEDDNFDFEQEEELKRWDMFWEYFERQWMPIKDSWNFSGLSEKEMESLKTTNNALESYNKHFSNLFKQGKVRLNEFVEVVEKESRDQAIALEDIRRGRRKAPKCPKKSGLEIPRAYNEIKERDESG